MKVVVRAKDASGYLSLSMFRDGWDVVTVEETFEAISHIEPDSLVLIDLGSTESGMKEVQALIEGGVDPRAVVVGDVAPEEPGETPVLTRPFNLDDLVVALESVAPEHLIVAPPEVVPAKEAPSRPWKFQLPQPNPKSPTETIPIEPTPVQPTAQPSTSHPPVAEPERPDPSSEEMAPILSVPSHARRLSMPSKWRPTRPEPQDQQPEKSTDTEEKGLSDSRRSSIKGRVEDALGALERIDKLIGDLPALRDPAQIGGLLVFEVVEKLSPEVATCFVRRVSGSLEVVASHGLSPSERVMNVEPTQPFFSGVFKGEAVLVSPVDLVRGMLGGIPGSRTEAYMAAPIVWNKETIAIIACGAASFTQKDLDRLIKLASDAARGMALSIRLERGLPPTE